MPGLLIEVGIAHTAVYRTMSDAEICQARRVICADWNVACPIDQEIVDASVPLQRRRRIQVAKTGDGAADTVGARRQRNAADCA